MAQKQINETWTLTTILAYINTPSCWDSGSPWYGLDELLDDIDWDVVASELIEPKNVRKFAKKIENEEVRLDVLKYLNKYARQYFLEAAEQKEYKEKVDAQMGIQLVMPNIRSKDENMQIFQQELLFLIEQIEKKGEFSGDKFSKLKQRIKDLEKQLAELKNENFGLKEKLERYKHPHAHGKYIPEKLNIAEFYNLMTHLAAHNIVRLITEPDIYGQHHLTCYHWDASKALFGYFVNRMNEIFNLRGARIPLNWEVFEPAINNYSDIIKEARKAFSTYNNSSSLQPERIKNSEIIEEAIQKRANQYLPF